MVVRAPVRVVERPAAGATLDRRNPRKGTPEVQNDRHANKDAATSLLPSHLGAKAFATGNEDRGSPPASACVEFAATATLCAGGVRAGVLRS